MVQMDKLAAPCGDECCVSPQLVSPAKPAGNRTALIREVFYLEWLTTGWMIIEAVVALVSGIAAGSLVLIAFGLDSVIELISAGVLMWRLSVELRHGHAFSEHAERLASRIGAVLLFVLAAYVVLAAGWKSLGAAWRGVLLARINSDGSGRPDHAVFGAPQARACR